MFQEQNQNYFGVISGDVMNGIVAPLDYKSHMCFLMASKGLYSFVATYPQPDDYTKKMINYARNKNIENFNFSIKHEGPRNKKNRQDIEKFFKIYYPPEDLTINVYGEIYSEKNSYHLGIMYHIFNTNKAAFKLLLEQGYKHNFNAWQGADLQHAAMDNNFVYIKVLLGFNHILVDRNFQGEMNGTALYWAFAFERFRMVKLLLTDPYVDVNTKNASGDTLLHVVVRKKNSEILKLLLAHPRINEAIKNNYGHTAYDYATDPRIKALLTLPTS